MVIRNAVLAAVVIGTAGCNTNSALQKMRLSQLERFETNATVVNAAAVNGEYVPASYDLYLKVDRKLIDSVLQPMNGMQTTVDASGRKINLSLQSIEARFQPGTPEIAITATARDEQSGVEANVQMDANLVIAEDPENPGGLLGRVSATRIVPKIAWGPFDFTRRRFARDLLSLEAVKLTEKLPAFTLPTTGKFAVGAPAGVMDTGQIPTSSGSWMRGEVTYPASRISGQVVVKHILVLSNGIHVFADVEGLQ